LDVAEAMDKGWIEASYSRNLRSLECVDCAHMNFVDCRDVECVDKESCAGSSFSTSGKFSGPRDYYNVRCLESESCEGATFSGIDRITCLGDNSCHSTLVNTVFANVKDVICAGTAACVGAVFGPNTSVTDSVSCIGTDSCQYAESFWVNKMTCTGAESCRGGKFFLNTAKLECNGSLACLRSMLQGKKKLRCGTAKSCKSLEWK